MPLDHAPEFAELNIFTAHPDPYYWLVDVQDPDGGPVLDEGGKQVALRVTPNTTPVTFATKTYDPFPVSFGDLGRDSDGGIREIPLTFSNAVASFMKLMDANDYFRDHRVTLTLVHSQLLGSPNAKSVFRAKVTHSTANWTSATLILSAYNNLAFDVPQSLVGIDCGHAYRGLKCGFTGDQSNTLGQCSKKITACKLRAQWEVDNDPSVATLADSRFPGNYGGFMGVVVGSFG